MASRYILKPDADGTYSILDTFTSRPVRYAGRELTGIPSDMASDGIRILRDLERAQRGISDPVTLNFRRAR